MICRHFYFIYWFVLLGPLVSNHQEEWATSVKRWCLKAPMPRTSAVSWSLQVADPALTPFSLILPWLRRWRPLPMSPGPAQHPPKLRPRNTTWNPTLNWETSSQSIQSTRQEDQPSHQVRAIFSVALAETDSFLFQLTPWPEKSWDKDQPQCSKGWTLCPSFHPLPSRERPGYRQADTRLHSGRLGNIETATTILELFFPVIILKSPYEHQFFFVHSHCVENRFKRASKPWMSKNFFLKIKTTFIV